MSGISIRHQGGVAQGRLSVRQRSGEGGRVSVRQWLGLEPAVALRSVRTWANWINDYRVGPLRSARPRSLKQLVWLVDQAIEAVDDVLAVMRSNGHFYAVPFGVRFVAASPHLLAPQHGRPTSMVEVPLLLPNRRRQRRRERPAFRSALEDLERALCYDAGHVDGRPHWGQYHTLTRDHVAHKYSGLEVFEDARRRFNAGGVFDNEHTRQLGIT